MRGGHVTDLTLLNSCENTTHTNSKKPTTLLSAKCHLSVKDFLALSVQKLRCFWTVQRLTSDNIGQQPDVP